jgi:hypothetical protein
VACAEALFASALPTGSPVTSAELDAVVAESLQSRGGVRQCAAEMAAVYGESPDAAVRRMRWALQLVAQAYGLGDRSSEEAS